jgi:ribonuclease HII
MSEQLQEKIQEKRHEKVRVSKLERQQAKLQREIERLYQMAAYERRYEDYAHIAGVDEVGRGPLAGPVAAGAVILPRDCQIFGLNDSKKLSEKKREALYEQIAREAIAWSVAFVSPARIDEINILQATYEAMRMAIANLAVEPDLLLCDAVTIPQINIRQVPIVRGDALSVSIAAASIMAKVQRDRQMLEWDVKYPQYGFAAHKGYGTAAHIAALRRFGPCPIHRASFVLHQ